jgi:hypothetical protein
MQPVFPYRPQSYPPRGNMWPQFGDEVLEDTLSLGEGVRQSLNRKREGMSEFHKEIMQRHGLAPKPEDVPVPMDDEESYDAPAASSAWDPAARLAAPWRQATS